MALFDPFKKILIRNPKGMKLPAHQKACPKCERIVHVDLERCPSCAHAPWTWHPNARFLVITVIIATFMLILVPILTSPDNSYGRGRNSVQYR